MGRPTYGLRFFFSRPAGRGSRTFHFLCPGDHGTHFCSQSFFQKRFSCRRYLINFARSTLGFYRLWSVRDLIFDSPPSQFPRNNHISGSKISFPDVRNRNSKVRMPMLRWRPRMPKISGKPLVLNSLAATGWSPVCSNNIIWHHPLGPRPPAGLRDFATLCGGGGGCHMILCLPRPPTGRIEKFHT